jgi:hypothetical protein
LEGTLKMSALAQQVVTPVGADPNAVPEIFANGPINIQGMGPVMTLTFTSVRPADFAASLKGPVQNYSAVAVCRLTLPTDVCAELKNLLNRTFVDAPMPIMASGSQLQQ